MTLEVTRAKYGGFIITLSGEVKILEEYTTRFSYLGNEIKYGKNKTIPILPHYRVIIFNQIDGKHMKRINKNIKKV